MSLEFDEPTHTYTWEGRRVPSVTQVIHEAGCSAFWGGGSWYMERGSALHLATQMHDEGELLESSVDPAIAGHLNAYRAFRESLRDDLTITDIEQPAYHPRGYAGMRDRSVVWRGKRGILEIKIGAAAAWHRLQTAAYLALVPETTVRLVVYLAETGRFKLEVHDDRTDWPVFASALALWQWKARSGLLTG